MAACQCYIGHSGKNRDAQQDRHHVFGRQNRAVEDIAKEHRDKDQCHKRKYPRRCDVAQDKAEAGRPFGEGLCHRTKERRTALARLNRLLSRFGAEVVKGGGGVNARGLGAFTPGLSNELTCLRNRGDKVRVGLVNFDTLILELL